MRQQDYNYTVGTLSDKEIFYLFSYLLGYFSDDKEFRNIVLTQIEKMRNTEED